MTMWAPGPAPLEDPVNRRELLRLGAFSPAYAYLSKRGFGRKLPASFWDDPHSPPTTPFVAPLPIPDPILPAAPFRPRGPDLSILTPAHLSRLRYHRIVAEEVRLALHPELPPSTVWRYRDLAVPSERVPSGLGPTLVAHMNEPMLVRHWNGLPEDHTGFGVPELTVHFHGGHVEARSDGFPEDIPELRSIYHPGESFDYFYPFLDVGFSTGEPQPFERAATQWYHDHLLDFTGPNVMRGLAGLVLVFDELDTGDESGTLHPATNLRLPSGRYDVPLVIADKLFAPDGSLVYVPEDFGGFLGDRYVVNGAVQPFLRVEGRKYRFRMLCASNARVFGLVLADERGRRQPYDHIANGGGLFSRTLREDFQLLGPAMRADIVVDFAQYPPGTVLYLENRIEQDDGRGPGGTFDDFDVEARGARILKFIVGERTADPSRVPAVLRPFEAIPAAVLRTLRRRHFRFERRNGAWAVNNELVDLERPVAFPREGQAEIWTVENGGGGWWHPIHIHQELFRVLSFNGERPLLPELRDGIARLDTVMLGGGDEAELYVRFQDFPGPFVFHCHNVEHEDHFMMARYDVVE